MSNVMVDSGVGGGVVAAAAHRLRGPGCDAPRLVVSETRLGIRLHFQRRHDLLQRQVQLEAPLDQLLHELDVLPVDLARSSLSTVKYK